MCQRDLRKNITSNSWGITINHENEHDEIEKHLSVYFSSVDWLQVGTAALVGGATMLTSAKVASAVISGIGSAAIEIVGGNRNIADIATAAAIGAGASLIGSGVSCISTKQLGREAIDSLSKQGSTQIKNTINSAINVAGKDRNTIKNISWTISHNTYKVLPKALVGKTTPGVISSMTSGFVSLSVKKTPLCK